MRRNTAVIEPLESRRLRSVSLDSSHVLHVDGTAGNDHVWVAINAGRVEAHVNTEPLKSFALSSVTKVVIRGFAGDDYLGLSKNFPLPLSLDGGSGNDVIIGGAKNDSLVGGDGDDNLEGGSGNDTLSGGSGNDKIFGDSGNDVLLGGAGNDYMQGGSGNDTLTGNSGRDVLNGNDGDDLIYAVDGEIDTISGGNGIDHATKDSIDHFNQLE